MKTFGDWAGRVGGSKIGGRAKIAALSVACAFSLFSTAALGQTRTFTLDRAQVSGTPDDGFMVHRPYAGEETRVYVNSALGFALNPLRDGHLQDDLQLEGGAPVTAQFPVYLSAGLQIEGIVGLAFHIPFTPLQLTGADPAGEVGVTGITDRHAAMNDLKFDGRIVAWESDNRKTRFGGFGSFTIPTGTEIGFGGDREATAMLALNAEHDFGKFLLTGHMGPHFRPDRFGAPSDLYVGSELRYAIGGFMPLRDNKVRLGLEIWGSTGIKTLGGESTFFQGRNTTVEWLAQGRFLVSRDERTFFNVGGGTRLSNGYGSADVRVLASIGRWWGFSDKKPDAPPPKVRVRDHAGFHEQDRDGDGYPDDADACPDVKEDGEKPNPNDGCPAPADRDKDGILDIKDKCPDEAEDFDDIMDRDGCPETDADGDKVKDQVDKCPLEPGPPNKDAEKNGCPIMTKVTSDGMVSLLNPIEFDHGKSTIKPVSFPILKEVAVLMESRPTIKIAVQGHTDNVGAREFNTKLSDDRAASVVRYLKGLGIDGSRLTSKGFGPDKPIDTNDTDAGRAHNRRVDFVIEGGAEAQDDAWE